MPSGTLREVILGPVPFLLWLAEFADDKEACDVLNASYEASRANHKALIKLLRLRRQQILPWESAAK